MASICTYHRKQSNTSRQETPFSGASQKGSDGANPRPRGAVQRHAAGGHGGTESVEPAGSEDEADAEVEAVEEADGLTLPVRLEGAGVEGHRLRRGDRVEERHEVVAGP